MNNKVIRNQVYLSLIPYIGMIIVLLVGLYKMHSISKAKMILFFCLFALIAMPIIYLWMSFINETLWSIFIENPVPINILVYFGAFSLLLSLISLLTVMVQALMLRKYQ